MKAIYVAHPLNAPTPEERQHNRGQASLWAAWLAKTFGVAVVCDWIVLSSVWSEAEGRSLGLEIDKALIERCDGLFLCGPRESDGMRVERRHADERGIDSLSFATGCLPEDLDARAITAVRMWIDSLPEAA